MRQRVWVLVARSPGQNHNSLFRVGQLSRDIEREHGLAPYQLALEDRRLLFECWYVGTPIHLLRHSKDDYWTEYLEAFNDAKRGLGDSSLARAWQLSGSLPPPPESFRVFPDPESGTKRRIVALAHHLAGMADGRILLPVHAIAALAAKEGIRELNHPEKVNRVVRALQLIVLEKLSECDYKTRKSIEYRYLLPIYSRDELLELERLSKSKVTP